MGMEDMTSKICQPSVLDKERNKKYQRKDMFYRKEVDFQKIPATISHMKGNLYSANSSHLYKTVLLFLYILSTYCQDCTPIQMQEFAALLPTYGGNNGGVCSFDNLNRLKQLQAQQLSQQMQDQQNQMIQMAGMANNPNGQQQLLQNIQAQVQQAAQQQPQPQAVQQQPAQNPPMCNPGQCAPDNVFYKALPSNQNPLATLENIDQDLANKIKEIFQYSGIRTPWNRVKDFFDEGHMLMPDPCMLYTNVRDLLKVFEALKERISDQLRKVQTFINRSKTYLSEDRTQLNSMLGIMEQDLIKMKTTKDRSNQADYAANFNRTNQQTQKVIAGYSEMKDWLYKVLTLFKQLF